jgi:hypothetical protein
VAAEVTYTARVQRRLDIRGERRTPMVNGIRAWLVECMWPTMGCVSEAWVQQQHLLRVPYDGPCWNWPVRR